MYNAINKILFRRQYFKTPNPEYSIRKNTKIKPHYLQEKINYKN